MYIVNLYNFVQHFSVQFSFLNRKSLFGNGSAFSQQSNADGGVRHHPKREQHAHSKQKIIVIQSDCEARTKNLFLFFRPFYFCTISRELFHPERTGKSA